jgi:alkaline phosphatase
MRPLIATVFVLVSVTAQAQTSLRIVPVNGATIATGSRFDIRVEATAQPGGQPPRGLTIALDGVDITAKNILAPGDGGERGRGGVGTPDGYEPARDRAAQAPPHTTNFLQRDVTLASAGRHTLTASTADGVTATVAWDVFAWQDSTSTTPPVRNVILLLGDGMGLAIRTAARVLSRGYSNGKADGRLAMDTMEATGLVMTTALNALITDSAPGMSSYVTGHKAANNMAGVYPDNTWPARARGDDETPRDGLGLFDNPRTEYLGALLRRTRGPGFNVGIVTTADLTDATPAANAIHSSNRLASEGIASRYLDDRRLNGVSVLMGGGLCQFVERPAPDAPCGRKDGRPLEKDFRRVGFTRVLTRTELKALGTGADAPRRLLGLFQLSNMSVAFDKIGAGVYSDELADDRGKALRDQPMLEEMTTAALASLEAHSPKGFYLMVEGASVDKQEHVVDAERAIWDVIEFDRAVAVALDFARRTNTDTDPQNDTLVIVTADHETGGVGLIGVGNPAYSPKTLGHAVRDYAAVFRFEPDQATLAFFPNYERDAQGYPVDPDPTRKLLLGWAAGPDRYENWLANRRAVGPALNAASSEVDGRIVVVPKPATANPARDGSQDDNVNGGRRIRGFLVAGTIENGATGCPAKACPPGTDTAADPLSVAGHTASDVPLSVSGPGAMTFSGTYDNTEVFGKILRLMGKPGS